MRKIKTLALAALPIATVGTMAATMISCKKGTESRTIDYEAATEWVTKNYGKTTTVVAEAKSIVSNWSFGGYVSDLGTGSTASTRMGWLLGHLTNFLHAYSQQTAEAVTATGIDQAGSKGESGEGILQLGDFAFIVDDELEPVTTGIQNYDAICGDNFATTLNTYFFNGITKNVASYIVNDSKKTLTIKGTMSVNQTRGSGKDYLKMPNCSISFDSKGRLTNINFNFDSNATCGYQWVTTSVDGFTFVMLSGSFIDIKFNY